jgi:transglutaminase-like putative cysteine protease
MQHALRQPLRERPDADLMAALPLYAASLVASLAGLGAVAVTTPATNWGPLWIFLAIAGHGVSLALRRARINSEAVFYPVMLLGSVVVMQQLLTGSTLVGLDIGLGSVPPDMATAMLVGCIAVIRSFTLVTNASLLFSPVPGITMLALAAASNPNPEIPLFFALLILSALFLMGYEAHLRRVTRTGQPAGSVFFHLLTAWIMTVGMSVTAILFAAVVQPVIGPLSPFALPAIQRIQSTTPAGLYNGSQAPVGTGPIFLSPQPVFEVYTNQPGRLRTGTFSSYTGRGWSASRGPTLSDIQTDRQVDYQPPAEVATRIRPRLYTFDFPPDPELPADVPRRTVLEDVVTRGPAPQGIPAFGRITHLLYPKPPVYLHVDGSITGVTHQMPGRVFQVSSQVAEIPPARLRAVPPVDAGTFNDPETLSLPQSTQGVQDLAHDITRGVASPYDRLQLILNYINTHCHYTLQEEPTPVGEDAAAYYLLTTKRGACGLAATAAAIMCRAVGIPARVAVGYIADEPLPSGDGYMVRQAHAHMWIETYFAGFGWVPSEPAPPMATYKEPPLDAALNRIRAIFGHVGGGGLDAVLLLTVIAATLALGSGSVWAYVKTGLRQREHERRLRADSPGAATAVVYAQALRLLERRGWRHERWMTPGEYLDWLRDEWRAAPEALQALETLTARLQVALYAGAGSVEALSDASEALRTLTRVAPARASDRGARRTAARPAGEAA